MVSLSASLTGNNSSLTMYTVELFSCTLWIVLVEGNVEMPREIFQREKQLSFSAPTVIKSPKKKANLEGSIILLGSHE